MSASPTCWRQLVQRRLWPVAILLVAALAAVPLALAKEPDAGAGRRRPPRTPTRPASPRWRQPIVAAGRGAGPRQAPQGARHGEEPVRLPRGARPAPAAAPTRRLDASGADDPDDAGGTDERLARRRPVPATPARRRRRRAARRRPPADPTPAPQDVRDARADRPLRRRADALERMTSSACSRCRSARTPVLIYLGVPEDGKTAMFLVEHGVEAVGDGDCSPSPEECETIRLRAGETEFLDVIDETGAVDRAVPARPGQDPQRQDSVARRGGRPRSRARPPRPPATLRRDRARRAPARRAGRRRGAALAASARSAAPRAPGSSRRLPGVSLRVVTAGESHGPGLTSIVEGLPAGLELDREAVNARHGAPPARPRPRRADEDRARHAPRSPPASATAARSAAPSRSRSPTATTRTGRSG